MAFRCRFSDFLEIFFWNFLIPTIFLSGDRLEGLLDLQGVRNEESKRIEGRGEKGEARSWSIWTIEVLQMADLKNDLIRGRVEGDSQGPFNEGIVGSSRTLRRRDYFQDFGTIGVDLVETEPTKFQQGDHSQKQIFGGLGRFHTFEEVININGMEDSINNFGSI